MPVFSLCACSFQKYVRLKHLSMGGLGFSDTALPKGNRNMRGILEDLHSAKGKGSEEIILT